MLKWISLINHNGFLGRMGSDFVSGVPLRALYSGTSYSKRMATAMWSSSMRMTCPKSTSTWQRKGTQTRTKSRSDSLGCRRALQASYIARLLRLCCFLPQFMLCNYKRCSLTTPGYLDCKNLMAKRRFNLQETDFKLKAYSNFVREVNNFCYLTKTSTSVLFL